MTAKILEHIGEVVYRIMCLPLTIEEVADRHVQLDMHTFRESIEECVQKKLTWDDLEEVGIPDTLKYLPYVDMQMRIRTRLHSLT